MDEETLVQMGLRVGVAPCICAPELLENGRGSTERYKIPVKLVTIPVVRRFSECRRCHDVVEAEPIHPTPFEIIHAPRSEKEEERVQEIARGEETSCADHGEEVKIGGP